MNSIALIKTTALIGLYFVPLFILIVSFFSRKPLKPWVYILQSIALLFCASVLLVMIQQMKSMSDELVQKDFHMKFGQIMTAQNHIKENQALIVDLIKNGESELEFTAKLDSPKDLLDDEEKSDKDYFDSFMFIFEVISALFAIPLAVNFFVHGITSRHYTTNVYEVPKSLYGRISRLESGLGTLIVVNFFLIIVVLFGVFS
tara:strand:+ start:3393 stop:3998 length:606 start_codon:yes stop_codon:yes gene_type:complete